MHVVGCVHLCDNGLMSIKYQTLVTKLTLFAMPQLFDNKYISCIINTTPDTAGTSLTTAVVQVPVIVLPYGNLLCVIRATDEDNVMVQPRTQNKE